MRWVAIPLALAVLFISVSATQARSPRIRETTLENGLKVFVLENHKSPAVTFQVPQGKIHEYIPNGEPAVR